MKRIVKTGAEQWAWGNGGMAHIQPCQRCAWQHGQVNATSSRGTVPATRACWEYRGVAHLSSCFLHKRKEVLKKKESKTTNDRPNLPDLKSFLNLLYTCVYNSQFGWLDMPLLIIEIFVSLKQYLFKKTHVLICCSCLQNKWAKINNIWQI